MAPFHIWVPQVIRCFKYPLCFYLSTAQKIAPLYLIIRLCDPIKIMPWLCLFNVFVRRLGGIYQSKFRPLLAYSSLNHIGWFLFLRSIRSIWRGVFFLIYSIHSFIIFFILNNKRDTSMIALVILSLASFPPLFGFLMKIIAFHEASLNVLPFAAILVRSIMLILSVVNIYYYLRIVYVSMLMDSNGIIWVINKYKYVIVLLFSLYLIPFLLCLLSFNITVVYRLCMASVDLSLMINSLVHID